MVALSFWVLIFATALIEPTPAFRLKLHHVKGTRLDGRGDRLRTPMARRGSFVSDNYPFDIVTAQIQIGTPPRTYNMSVETGVSAVWAFDKHWGHLRADQIPYDPAVSTTAVNEKDEFESRTGRAKVYGAQYSDVVTVSNITLNPQVLGMVRELDNYDNPNEFPTDGVLGMGWSPDAKDVNDKWAAPILRAFGEGQPRFYFVYLAPYGSTKDSFIEFGANTLPPNECLVPVVAVSPLFSADMTYQPPQPLFHIHSFHTGDYESRGYWLASVDTGTAVIQMHEAEYSAVLKLTRADYDWDWRVFTVPCEKTRKLSPWTFGIGEAALSIAPSQYAVDIGMGDGKCAVALAKAEERDSIVLGTPFIRTFCVVFDIDEDEVLFALAKQ